MTVKKKSVAYDPIITYDQELKRWNVPSKTHVGHSYAVRIDPCSEHFVCTCVWGRGMAKHTNKECIHVQKVREWLEKSRRNESNNPQ